MTVILRSRWRLLLGRAPCRIDMALELLIGAIRAREEGGAEDDPSDSGAHENQTQGKSLAQQDAPPVFWKRLSKVLPGSGRNPAIETARIILGCRLPAFQAAHGRAKRAR